MNPECYLLISFLYELRLLFGQSYAHEEEKGEVGNKMPGSLVLL